MGKITRRLFCYAKSYQDILLFSSQFQYCLYVLKYAKQFELAAKKREREKKRERISFDTICDVE